MYCVHRNAYVIFLLKLHFCLILNCVWRCPLNWSFLIALIVWSFDQLIIWHSFRLWKQNAPSLSFNYVSIDSTHKNANHKMNTIVFKSTCNKCVGCSDNNVNLRIHNTHSMHIGRAVNDERTTDKKLSAFLIAIVLPFRIVCYLFPLPFISLSLILWLFI